MRMRVLLCVAVAVLLVGTFAPWLFRARAAPGPVVAVPGQVVLDPLQASSLADLRLLGALFEPLVRLDPSSGRLLPALASRWEIAGDGASWTFHLDPQATWSDGSPVTATQAALGIERHRQGTSSLGGLLGAVHRIAIGRSQITLHLTRPVPWLGEILSCPVFAPTHDSQTGSAPGTWSDPRRIIGNGPLAVAAWTPRHHLDLVPRATYRGPQPARGGVRLLVVDSGEAAVRLYLSGQVDVVTRLGADVLHDLRRHRQPGLMDAPMLATEFYRLRCVPRPGLDPITHPALRRALAASVDREALVRELLPGNADPACGLVPPTLGSATQAGPAVDARAELARAERDLGPCAQWPALRLLVPGDTPERVRVAERLADRWQRELGIRVQVLALAGAELRARERTQDYELCRGSLVADYAEAGCFLDAFRSGDGYNRTGFSDPAYDTDLAAATGPGRQAALAELEQRLLTAAPVLPLYHLRAVWLVRPGLSGISANRYELLPLHLIARP